MNLCLTLLHPPLYAANTGPGLAGPHEEGDGEDCDEPQQVVTGHRLLVRIVYKGGQACTDSSGSLYYPGDVIIVSCAAQSGPLHQALPTAKLEFL